jgi:hypothetical protein
MSWEFKAKQEASWNNRRLKREIHSAINHIEKASAVCARYGMILGNGGDIASMLNGIASELANGDARPCAELAEEAL